MIKFIPILWIIVVLLSGCYNKKPITTEDDYTATLMTLDPGHFHSVLIQKNMYPEVNPTAYVYAAEGSDVQLHLDIINQYNSRIENPTQKVEEVYTGSEFVDKMFLDKPGNVMVLAVNNKNKTDYILRAVKDSVHVFSEKPMAITFRYARRSMPSSRRLAICLPNLFLSSSILSLEDG